VIIYHTHEGILSVMHQLSSSPLNIFHTARAEITRMDTAALFLHDKGWTWYKTGTGWIQEWMDQAAALIYQNTGAGHGRKKHSASNMGQAVTSGPCFCKKMDKRLSASGGFTRPPLAGGSAPDPH